MICEKCGRNVPPWEGKCSECNPVTEEVVYEPFEPFEPIKKQPTLTLDEFYHHPNMKNLKKSITRTLTCMYVILAINIVLALTVGMSSFFGIILLLVITILIQVKHSKIPAGILLGDTVLNSVVSLIVYKKVSGVFILLVALNLFTGIRKFHMYWQGYQTSGEVPYGTK